MSRRCYGLCGTIRIIAALAALAAFALLPSCGGSSKLSLPEQTVKYKSVLLIVDEDGNQREVTDAGVISEVRITLLPLFIEKGKPIMTTPATSRRYIIFNFGQPDRRRFDLWPELISDGQTTWPLNEAIRNRLFALLGYQMPSVSQP